MSEKVYYYSNSLALPFDDFGALGIYIDHDTTEDRNELARSIDGQWNRHLENLEWQTQVLSTIPVKGYRSEKYPTTFEHSRLETDLMVLLDFLHIEPNHAAFIELQHSAYYIPDDLTLKMIQHSKELAKKAEIDPDWIKKTVL